VDRMKRSARADLGLALAPVSTWPPLHLLSINIEVVAVYRCLTYFLDYKNEPVFGLLLCGERLLC
jgi:hypothetical protein